MICLDTNFLIRSLLADSEEAAAVIGWLTEETPVLMPAIAWYEFLCGCTLEEERVAKGILTGGIAAFDDPEAQEAARLFRECGKARKLRVDAMIAATAIVRGATLATNNQRDFTKFAALGLRLWQ